LQYSWGSNENPEFIRDFCILSKKAGKVQAFWAKAQSVFYDFVRWLQANGNL